MRHIIEINAQTPFAALFFIIFFTLETKKILFFRVLCIQLVYIRGDSFQVNKQQKIRFQCSGSVAAQGEILLYWIIIAVIIRVNTSPCMQSKQIRQKLTM